MDTQSVHDMASGSITFVEAVKLLDRCLHRDLQSLSAMGVEVTDGSQRTFSRDGYLNWSYGFEVRRSGEFEIEKVLVMLTVMEAEPTTVRLWSCGEIFQMGQQPSWRKTNECTRSLESLLEEGVGKTIGVAMETMQTAMRR